MDRKSQGYGQKIRGKEIENNRDRVKNHMDIWIENQKTVDRNSEVKRYKITWIGQKITGLWIENYRDIKNSLGELIDV